jgi:hypothetical protein
MLKRLLLAALPILAAVIVIFLEINSYAMHEYYRGRSSGYQQALDDGLAGYQKGLDAGVAIGNDISAQKIAEAKMDALCDGDLLAHSGYAVSKACQKAIADDDAAIKQQKKH